MKLFRYGLNSRNVLRGSVVMSSVFAIAVSCSRENKTAAPPESNASIVGGKEAGRVGTPAHVLESTVGISYASLAKRGQTFCSGTLIEDNVVLTAAHCFTSSTGQETKANPRDPFVIVMSRNASENLETLVVEKFVRHEGYNHNLTVKAERYNIPSNDIALVYLAQSVSVGKKPMKVPSVSKILPKEILLAGYGTTGTLVESSPGVFSWQSLFSRLSSKRNAFVPGEQKTESDTGVLRYLETEVKKVHELGFVMSTSELKNTPKGACPGDSGGPVYGRTASDRFVYGVLSTGVVGGFDLSGDGNPDVGCVGENTYTDVRAYASWIAQNL